MSGVLVVSTSETYPKSIQFREGGAAKDLTGITVTCRIGTNPVTTRTGTILDPTSGTVSMIFNGLPSGVYEAQIVMTSSDGVLPSEKFTINVEAAI